MSVSRWPLSGAETTFRPEEGAETTVAEPAYSPARSKPCAWQSFFNFAQKVLARP